MTARLLAALVLAAAALPAAAGERAAARPRLCPQDAPPGVRLPTGPSAARRPRARPRRGPGLHRSRQRHLAAGQRPAAYEVGYTGR